MAKEVCGYCDEEKNKSVMSWDYPLQAYICNDCRKDLVERWGKQPRRKHKESENVI